MASSALPRQLSPQARILGIGELVAVEVGDRLLGYSGHTGVDPRRTAAAGCLNVGDSPPSQGGLRGDDPELTSYMRIEERARGGPV